MWATHDAPASAEVVVAPEICLYWNRDGADVPAGLLPAWGDRCMATAPARGCPCGSYQLRWGEDELCRESDK